MRGLFERLRGLVFRGAEERALRDEVEFHLEMETEKLVREGWEPDSARREAHLRFGGVDRMQERTREARGWGWLEDLARDLRHGVRGLRRDPGYTATAGLALMVGVAAVTASFTLVNGVLLRPLPYDDAHELVELRELGAEGRRFFPSFPNFLDWRDQATAVQGMVAIQPMGDQPVLDAGPPVRVPVLAITRDFADLVGVRLAAGRDFLPGEHVPGAPAIALVSHAFWMDRLAGAPLDQATFTLFGQRYTVVGVFESGFELFYPGDVFISAERWPNTVRSAHAHRVLARVRSDLTLSAAKQDLDGIAAELKDRWGDETQAESVQVTPLRTVVLGDQDTQLGLLLGASALVLLIACANVASATLARGVSRRREFAVRRSIGAGRFRLVRQLLTESILLSTAAGAIGLGVAWVAVRLVQTFGGDAIVRLDEVGMDLRVVAVALAVIGGTGLLFGLYPALRNTATGAAEALRAGGRTVVERRGHLWDGLIATEVGLALVLTIGAGLLTRSLINIVTLDSGWDPEGVIQIAHTPPSGVFESEFEAKEHYTAVRRAIEAMPGVTGVGIGSMLPLDAGAYTAPAHIPATGEVVPGYTGWRLIDDGYLDALGVQLLEGREFRDGDDNVTIVNRALADLAWPGRSPLGEQIRSNYDSLPRTVVGVVEVARDWRYEEAEQAEMFVPIWSRADRAWERMFIFVKTDGDPTTLVPGIRTRIRELNDRVPAEFSMLSDTMGRTIADRRFVAAVLLSYAAAAVLLALIGLWGIVSYSIARRRREIGIRRALGASHGRVRVQFLREVRSPVVIGMVFGLVGAWMGASILESMLYEMTGRDPGIMVVASLCFTAAAIAAVIIPTGRAARVEPAEVLNEG